MRKVPVVTPTRTTRPLVVPAQHTLGVVGAAHDQRRAPAHNRQHKDIPGKATASSGSAPPFPSGSVRRSQVPTGQADWREDGRSRVKSCNAEWRTASASHRRACVESQHGGPRSRRTEKGTEALRMHQVSVAGPWRGTGDGISARGGVLNAQPGWFFGGRQPQAPQSRADGIHPPAAVYFGELQGVAAATSKGILEAAQRRDRRGGNVSASSMGDDTDRAGGGDCPRGRSWLTRSAWGRSQVSSGGSNCWAPVREW